MGTLEIQLRDHVAVVDEADAGLVAGYRWRAVHRPRSNVWYVEATTRTLDGSRSRTVGIHRIILGEPMERIDHINGDGLDNRRANLRLADPSQNCQNRPVRTGSLSQFKGVAWHRLGHGWEARIQARGHRHWLGIFQDPADAARAYDAAARELHGAFARVNFPGAGEHSARLGGV